MTSLQFYPQAAFDQIAKSKMDPQIQTAVLSDMCRFNTLYMVKKAGSGHLGTSFSAMEIITTLYRHFLKYDKDDAKKYDQDMFFSSKGHDAPGYYSVLAAFGFLPFEKIHHLRRLEGLPGHPDVKTPHMVANTGSLGMGVSKAKGFAIAKAKRKKPGNIFVMTGDGELQEGQFWESLRSAVKYKLNNIIVLVDNNKLQSDTYVEDVLSLGNLKAQFESFGWKAWNADGHDIATISSTLTEALKYTQGPKAIIFDTNKGHGVSFMHASKAKNPLLYNYHSGAPSDEDYVNGSKEIRERIESTLKASGVTAPALSEMPRDPTAPVKKMHSGVEAYSKAITRNVKANPKIQCLVADLVKDTGLYNVKTDCPEQFWECGIAEQDMVSMAGAMALDGLLPIVHSFACFVTPRANEQIFNNYSEYSKVLYTCTLAGLLPGGPGHSHQSVRDISLMASMPKMLAVQPTSAAEIEWMTDYLIKTHPDSGYLRLSSVPHEIDYPADNMAIGVGRTLKPGKDIAVIAYGGMMLTQAFVAAEKLEAAGSSTEVINMPWLNVFSDEWLKGLMKRQSRLVLIDDHFAQGGMGQMLMSKLVGMGLIAQHKILHLFVNDVPACGRNDEVLKVHGLDGASMAEKIRSWMND